MVYTGSKYIRSLVSFWGNGTIKEIKILDFKIFWLFETLGTQEVLGSKWTTGAVHPPRRTWPLTFTSEEAIEKNGQGRSILVAHSFGDNMTCGEQFKNQGKQDTWVSWVLSDNSQMNMVGPTELEVLWKLHTRKFTPAQFYSYRLTNGTIENTKHCCMTKVPQSSLFLIVPTLGVPRLWESMPSGSFKAIC